MKTIKVSEGTWLELTKLKYKLKIFNLNEVIRMLLKETKHVQ